MAQTMIGVQDEYIATINAGLARWSHRKGLGHFARILRGAWNRADKALRRLGFDDAKQISLIIKDANDMAVLERNAMDEE